MLQCPSMLTIIHSALQGDLLASIHAGRLAVLRAADCSRVQEAAVSTSHIRTQIQGSGGVLPRLAWSPSGHKLAVWGSVRRQANAIHLYCTESWNPAGILAYPDTCLYTPVWGLHGIAALTAESGVILLPTEGPDLSPALLQAQPLKQSITQLPKSRAAFSPDGGTMLALVTGDVQRQIEVEVWAVASKQRVQAWVAPPAPQGMQAILDVQLWWSVESPRIYVAVQLAERHQDASAGNRKCWLQYLLDFSI